ncbi:MAG: tetratricopeptide repeat-containing glycosyltransferase family protein [Tepidisphaeraceae bacterium]|jgi:hypothetical protein
MATEGHTQDAQIRLSENETACRQSIQRNPADAGAHFNLGSCLLKRGQIDEAISAWKVGLRLRPEIPEAYGSLADAYMRKEQFDDAIEAARTAVRLKPDLAFAWNNLGAALAAKTNIDEAIAAYRNAIGFKPDFAQAHWNLSLALLLRGDFAEGWEEYEWRFSMQDFPIPKFNFRQPRWRGEELAGRRILLYCEQGMGDAIQFVRYVPLVVARGGRVVMVGPMELFTLLRSFPGVEEVVAPGPWPAFDVQCPLLSLPRIFRTRAESIPAPIPYIRPDPHRVQAWKDRFIGIAGKRNVGLAWAGRPNFGNDRNRSIALEQLSPLTAFNDIAFVSLQKGEAAKQAADMTLIDLTAELHDFADTAALIANLDLVISVDTAVAHLAGAMGKPVWVLLPLAPDWRWRLNREDSAWYPSMRLFRQPSRRDWKTPIAAMSEAMKSVAKLQPNE